MMGLQWEADGIQPARPSWPLHLCQDHGRDSWDLIQSLESKLGKHKQEMILN